MLRDDEMAKRQDALIVGDNSLLLQTLWCALVDRGFKVSEVRSGADASRLVSGLRPEVAVVFGTGLPDGSGLETCRAIRARDTDAVIILIDDRDPDQEKGQTLLQSYEAGADDYIAGPVAPRVLVARIDAKLKRLSNRKPRRIQAGDLSIDTARHTARLGGRPVFLRKREFEILAMMASSPGMLKRYEELEVGLSEPGCRCSARTIGVHVHRIRKALSQESSYEFIHTVWGLGYRFEAVSRGAD